VNNGGFVTLSLLDSSSNLTTLINTGIPDVGSYAWYVMPTIPSGKNYAIELVSTEITAPAISGLFTIIGTSGPDSLSITVPSTSHSTRIWHTGSVDPTQSSPNALASISASPLLPTNGSSTQSYKDPAIVGGVLGGIVGISFVIGCLFCVFRCYKRRGFLKGKAAARFPPSTTNVDSSGEMARVSVHGITA
jgi:hypothetical protein